MVSILKKIEDTNKIIFGYTTDEIKTFLSKQYTDCMIARFSGSDYYLNNITFWSGNEYMKGTPIQLDELLNLDQNNTGNLFCPHLYDGYLCWPNTPAGTIVTQNCPDFVEGFNKKFIAHKTCLENGSWYIHPETQIVWSNYTSCIDYEDLEFRQMVNELFIKGYSISLVTLILSMIIFLGFRNLLLDHPVEFRCSKANYSNRSLRCTRIRIHVHLFMSLALTCIAWIFWYKLIVERPINIRNNPIWCIILHIILHYLMLVNYFWMFCEGLHLHLVLVVVFVKDNVIMRWFIVIGWFIPFLIIISYSIARAYHPTDSSHCWMEDSELIWLLTVPVCICLVTSFIFLINVVRVLFKKLHPCANQPAPLAMRKAVRATIILIPLFGLQHILLPVRPEAGTQIERIYQIISAILVSLQGFCVSCLFCFANHDVLIALRCCLSRVMPNLISPLPTSTNTGQIGTGTQSRESRELGV